MFRKLFRNEIFDNEAGLSGSDSGDERESSQTSSYESSFIDNTSQQEEPNYQALLEQARQQSMEWLQGAAPLVNSPEAVRRRIAESQEEFQFSQAPTVGIMNQSQEERPQRENSLPDREIKSDEEDNFDSFANMVQNLQEGTRNVKGAYRAFFYTSYEDQKQLIGPEVKWCVFQRERCPKTGKLHWQGGVTFTQRFTFKQALEKLGWWRPPGQCKTRIAQMLGRPDHVKAYCSKVQSRIEGTFEEHGTAPKKNGEQGKRNDLNLVACAVKEGKNFNQIADEFPVSVIKYARGISALIEALTKPRTDICEIYLLLGDSGCGKTTAVKKRSQDLYIKKANTHWWNGYMGERDVLIDEMSYEYCMPLREILSLANSISYQAETKGGHVQVKATRVFITSNTNPENWWPNQDLRPFYRRVKKLWYFTRTNEKILVDDRTDPSWGIPDNTDFSEVEKINF